MVSFMKDEEEVVNFIKLKTNNLEIIDIQVGKTLNLADLTSLEVESMDGALFKDKKLAYPKLCLKITIVQNKKFSLLFHFYHLLSFCKGFYPIYFLSFCNHEQNI